MLFFLHSSSLMDAAGSSTVAPCVIEFFKLGFGMGMRRSLSAEHARSTHEARKKTLLPFNLLLFAKALRAGETTSADSRACASLTWESRAYSD